MSSPPSPISPLDWLRLVDRADPPFSVTARAVTLRLGTLASGKGAKRGTCFASVAKLAEIGLGESTVRRATAELQNRGFLHQHKRGGRGGDGRPRATDWWLTQPPAGERLSPASSAGDRADEKTSQPPAGERLSPVETPVDNSDNDSSKPPSTAPSDRLNRSPQTPQESSYQERSSSSSLDTSPRARATHDDERLDGEPQPLAAALAALAASR